LLPVREELNLYQIMAENSLQKDKKNTFLLIAGEASGDAHGAGLIRSLKKEYPGCSTFGIGGEQMRKEGMELLYSIDRMAILGIVEVIRHLPFLRRVFQTLIKEAVSRKPDAVILIDYPDFNIRLARKIRNRFENRIKIMYYISPQVWAWRKKRIHTIAKYCDVMAVVFPFEEDLYKETGLKVKFVGHPLLDSVKPSLSKEDFFNKHGFNPDNPVIGLLPGSRHQEIIKHLPQMLEAMDKLQNEKKNIQVIIGKAQSIPEETYNSILTLTGHSEILSEDIYDIMHFSRLIVVSSGTATLETAIAGTPMVIVYKMASFSYFVAKKMVSLPYIGLVNIVHGSKIVPELVQDKVSVQDIYHEVGILMSDHNAYDEIKMTLLKTKSLLGDSGASGRAVDLLTEVLNS
jgi:lipid-A-disaccharide synthase